MKTIEIKDVQASEIIKNLKRAVPNKKLRDSVSIIIEDVRESGDRALISYTKKFDGVDISKGFRVSEKEIENAESLVEKKFLNALIEAKKNIEEFHERQSASSWLKTDRGQMIGQLVGPVEAAGLYVPAGSSGYPSTVLMTSIPAKIAGVEKIIMVTPPAKNGKVSPHTLAAASICGIDEIYAIGGAQAISALAYGTKTVPKVDVIVGPGNAYVAEAKRQVYGNVGLDMVAGPSEVVVVADIKADPSYIAADLISQAEHDSDATAVLVTNSKVLAKKVEEKINEKINKIPRGSIAKKALEDKGVIFITESIDDAFDLINIVAPEHLVVLVEQPTRWLPFIKNAGAVFLGQDSVQSAGDYSLGPNHVLPTGGNARFSSPLCVETFQKSSNIVWLGKEALKEKGQASVIIANAEGFEGHARAVNERLKK